MWLTCSTGIFLVATAASLRVCFFQIYEFLLLCDRTFPLQEWRQRFSCKPLFFFTSFLLGSLFLFCFFKFHFLCFSYHLVKISMILRVSKQFCILDSLNLTGLCIYVYWIKLLHEFKGINFFTFCNFVEVISVFYLIIDSLQLNLLSFNHEISLIRLWLLHFQSIASFLWFLRIT